MDKLIKEIERLKKEKDAVILAHYYQNPEIQDIADYVGDSFYLSKIGKEVSNKVIVYCGVKFMAESAKILSPEKTVLFPVIGDATCCMEYMADKISINEMKKKYPEAAVVTYINSSTEAKTVSDSCCTSSSAEKIVRNIENKQIIFVPDKNLASYVQEKVPEKEIIAWNGCCHIHDKVKKEDIHLAKEEYGNHIKVLVHPECRKEVRDLADFLGSTGEIIKYVNKDKEGKEYLIVTEIGILHQLTKENPNKKFYKLKMLCKSMKRISLESIIDSLSNMTDEIKLSDDEIEKANRALENMLKYNK